jgi:hypothetical protein
VFGGRRDLDISVAGGTDGVVALPGDRVEIPLEKDSSDVLGPRRGGIDYRRGQASDYQPYDCSEAGLACHDRGSGGFSGSFIPITSRTCVHREDT